MKTVASLRHLLCEFTQEHDDISIEIFVKPRRSLWKQLFSCLRQPRDFVPPDLVQIPHNWTAVFARLGLFQDLLDWDSSLSTQEWPEALRPHCLLPGTGRLYSLPWWMEVSALHYRSDHLKEISADPGGLLRTWEGFLTACGLISRKRGKRNFYPLENIDVRGAVSVKDVLPFVWGRGGDLFSSDLGRSTMHKEEAVKGVEDYFLLARKAYLPLMRERAGSGSTLVEGGASMSFSRRRPRLTAAKRRPSNRSIRTVPLPGVKLPVSSFIAGHNLSVVRDSEKSREAFTLLRWLARADIQARYAGLIGALPCSVPAFEKVPGFGDEARGVYAGMLAGARPLPNITVCGTYEQLLDEVLWKMSREVLYQSYSSELLVQKLIMIQGEMDYLLSLYGDR